MGRHAPGGTIAISVTPRTVGAALGIVAAIATIGFVLYRLVEATQPIRTGVLLSSESATLISVRGLAVQGVEVLPQGWTPSAAGPGAAPARPQATVELEIGRPAVITATLTTPAPGVATCTLDPRPHGACLVKARFVSPADLRCDFECQAETPKP